MAASDMRNRRHVQPLLTWSTNAAHPVSLDQEPLQAYINSAPPNLGNSPVRSITQCIARRINTDDFYLMKDDLTEQQQTDITWWPQVLTIQPPELETQDDRQGKILMHTEYGLLTLLQDMPGVIRQHGLFKDKAWEEREDPITGRLYYTGNLRERLCMVLDCLCAHEFKDQSARYSNLQHYIITVKKLTEQEAIFLFLKVADVVAALHAVANETSRKQHRLRATIIFQIRIEQNPGPRSAKQMTMESYREKDLAEMIATLTTKIDELGQRLETRLSSLESGMEELNQRFQHIETSLEKTARAPLTNPQSSVNKNTYAQTTVNRQSCFSFKDDTQVLCWNVNGLERMLLQFDLFTHLEKCSIFALTETWKDQHLKIKPTGFHLYESLAQRDHKKGRSSGGIIVGIREAIKDKIERTEIEKQWIMICLRLDGEMRVCLIFAYLPPNEHYLTNCKYLLDQIEGKIVEGYEVLLAGDLNTRTGAMGILHNTLHLPCYLTTRRTSKDPVISTHSEQFIDRLDNNTLTILNGRTRGDRSGNYTYISARGSSVVDYCIVSHGLLGYVHDLYIEGLPHSDHLPLIIKMDMRWGPKQVSNPTSRVKKKYIWFPERATLFVEDLGGAYGFWNNSIENIMNNMVNQIKSAMVQNGMQIETKANNLMSKPWFDHECYIAKKIMKATLTKYIKSNRDLDRLEYVKTRNNYTSILNNKKKKYFCEIQEKLNNTYDSSEFWKTIARFRKRNYTQGNISISDWQQFYNKLLDTESIPDYEPVTMTFLNTDNELTKCITLNEISKEISRIRHGKATGFDDIMNEAIKALPKDYLISLKDIFNRILRTSEFPTTWLKSVIQPIFKNGDPDDPSNYRGIALLSNIAKLFTSILKSRLGSWIERRNIVPENQAGFRAAHSCQDHIFTLLSLIQMTLSRKRRKCYMFFVDLKKAFDTVPHSLLWRKLVDAGLNHRFVNLIKDYYTNMTAVVRWNNSFTAPIKVRSGVLQGEPMSPYLFILFLNDLIGLYNNSDLPGIYLPNYGYVHILLYADDIVLIGESKNNLQIKINMLRKYFETNLLTLNENKSKIVVFRNGGRLAQNDKWFWGERQLSVTTKYLYLGYPLTSGNSLNKVASHYKGKALAAIGAVWQVLTKSKMNSLNAAMRLLDSTVLPHMLYAAPCWALNQVKVVDQVQNIFLRRYLNLPKYTPGFMLRMECGRVSQEVIIIKQVLRFWMWPRKGSGKMGGVWQRNVVHRDLKLGNILLDLETGKVTLANFCLGKHLLSTNDLLKDQRGSPAYISPDVLSEQSMGPGMPYLGKPSDMWAMGVILYTMLYGQFPFYDSVPQELFRRIKAADFHIPSDGRVSEGTVTIIRSLLNLNPTQRLTAEELRDSLHTTCAVWYCRDPPSSSRSSLAPIINQ
ncbi:hypothetical protein LAZ67_20002691, partial [Cordylochernes scorpioides]